MEGDDDADDGPEESDERRIRADGREKSRTPFETRTLQRQSGQYRIRSSFDCGAQRDVGNTVSTRKCFKSLLWLAVHEESTGSVRSPGIAELSQGDPALDDHMYRYDGEKDENPHDPFRSEDRESKTFIGNHLFI